MISTSVPSSETLFSITAGMPNGFFAALHSDTSCLYRGSKIWRFSSSPGNTTRASGNMGIKLVTVVMLHIFFKMVYPAAALFSARRVSVSSAQSSNTHGPIVCCHYNQSRRKNIGRCLESVKDIADEIVVVDSGSTDRTQEICESFGARFIPQDFLGFIGQKNFALMPPHILLCYPWMQMKHLALSCRKPSKRKKKRGFHTPGTP